MKVGDKITKVANTNHLDMSRISRCLRQSLLQVCDKPVCVALMEFSPLQYTEKVSNKVQRFCPSRKSQKSATQTMKIGDMICVADFYDLCPRLSLRGSFGESRIVGVMEFGLKRTLTRTLIVTLILTLT